MKAVNHAGTLVNNPRNNKNVITSEILSKILMWKNEKTTIKAIPIKYVSNEYLHKSLNLGFLYGLNFGFKLNSFFNSLNFSSEINSGSSKFL